MIVAPMVDRSDLAWRLLTRSYLDEERSKELLAYTPMFHARLFKEQVKFRDAHFQPTRESLVSKEKSTADLYLDGNPAIDRPLSVQFCANKPDDLFEAAQYVAPYCDAVDLNLGCPQGIAKSGHYGAFLQEDWEAIHSMISKLRDELSVPITAKMRVLDTKEKTLEYAQMILSAGASILTVHGRRREQKSHNTGVADWKMIRYLRDNLPPETVLFANGNILNHDDIQPCLEATGADGVMSAEGNLSDPTIFAKPPVDKDSREYWRDPNNPEIGGYRLDGVFRRYLDIIHRYVLEQEPPARAPLYIPGDKIEHRQENGTFTIEPAATNSEINTTSTANGTSNPTKTKANLRKDNDDEAEAGQQPSRPTKKQRKAHNKQKDMTAVHNPNLKPLQGHLFQLLRPMFTDHVNIRDALAKCRVGHIAGFENVLRLVEEATRVGLDEEAARVRNHNSVKLSGQGQGQDAAVTNGTIAATTSQDDPTDVRVRCRRPFWVCQPHIRRLPEEAIKVGAMTVSKKEQKRLAQQEVAKSDVKIHSESQSQQVDVKSQAGVAESLRQSSEGEVREDVNGDVQGELPKEEALACG